MAQLTVQKSKLDGTSPTYSAADSLGDTFKNDNKTALHVKNGGTASITVTIDSKEQCSYGFDHDVAVTVAAGGEQIIGPFSVGRFNDDSGEVNVSYSDVTSVTVAVLAI